MKYLIRFFSILAIFLFLMNSSFAEKSYLEAAQEVEQTKKAIKEKGADWEAGITPLSYLNAQETKEQYLGFEDIDPAKKIDMKKLPPEYIFTPTIDLNKLPLHFDWRDYNGEFWLTRIKSQAGCGACVSFATIGALEASVLIDMKTINLPINLSEQHLFSCGRGDGGCVGGWNYLVNDPPNPPGATQVGSLEYLLAYGVPDELCSPYREVDNNCGASCLGWENMSIKISGFKAVVENSNLATRIKYMKAAIMQKPLLVSMEVYSDFNNYKGGVYKRTSNVMTGGHAIVIVGWDDGLGCWLVRNSWDITWGESGYFKIAYGECNIENRVDPVFMIPDLSNIASVVPTPVPTVPADPTPTPIGPTPTPTPGPSPTPMLPPGVVAYFSFDNGTDGWAYGSVPGIPDGKDTSSKGFLSLTPNNKQFAFSFFQSPVVSNIQKDKIYEITFNLFSSTNDPQKIPGIRFRAFNSTFEKITEKVINSMGTFSESPVSYPKQIKMIYEPPQNSTAVNLYLAFDLFHLDPNDDAAANIILDSCVIKEFTEGNPSADPIVEYTFDTGAEGWEFQTVPQYPATIASIDGRLGLTPDSQNVAYGFWQSPIIQGLSTGKYYRVNFEAYSDQTDPKMVPSIRFRTFDASSELTEQTVINSLGDASESPTDAAVKTYSFFYQPPQANVGQGIRTSFELYHFTPADNKAAQISVDKVTIKEYTK